jgi:hypothetical protein
MAPDKHQVTAGEWKAVNGHASVKCSAAGTHVVIHLSGLIADGVYTVWLATFKAPGFDGTFDNMIGLGVLGRNDGSENTIVASPDGEGQLSVFQPAGPLSLKGETSDCLLDEFEFRLLAAYHIDGQTHGGSPGPGCDYLEAYAWIYVP